jgi:hypothetical protein
MISDALFNGLKFGEAPAGWNRAGACFLMVQVGIAKAGSGKYNPKM